MTHSKGYKCVSPAFVSLLLYYTSGLHFALSRGLFLSRICTLNPAYTHKRDFFCAFFNLVELDKLTTTHKLAGADLVQSYTERTHSWFCTFRVELEPITGSI